MITDPADPRVDAFRALRARESSEVMWAEGPTVVTRLLASPWPTRAVLVSPAAHARLHAELARHPTPDQPEPDQPTPDQTTPDQPEPDQPTPDQTTQAADQPAADQPEPDQPRPERQPPGPPAVFVADQAVINAIVGFDLHRGAIAVADRARFAPLADMIRAARVLVVLEGVNDPENLGAIARSARALGADGLVLDPTCADPFYRRSVRVSMGEILHLPVARAPLDQVCVDLAAAGFAVWALTPRSSATPIGELAGRRPDRVALVFGAEGPGLSAGLLERLVNVRIPIHHDVDSLNVGHAVAATLAVLGAVRR